MSRVIICENEDKVGIRLEENFSPFLLVDCDGIYSFNSDVAMSNNTMVDGSIYLGSVVKMRNIILNIAIKDEHAKSRNTLYQVFKPKSQGTFTYIEKDNDYEETRVIDYYVENIKITSSNKVRNAEISLLCPDPFFRDIKDFSITMANWRSNFIFQHQFKSSKEELGTRLFEKLKEIDNESSADNIGITVTMIAEGNVVNPVLYHSESKSFIRVGTDRKPLNMIRGDRVIITTETNNKNVYLIHNGLKKTINEYLDEDSVFIQLNSGKNSLRYGASQGEDYLTVDVSFRYRYLGV